MDLESLLATKKFLDELSASVRNIILSSFPNLTAQEKEEVDLEVRLKLWRKVARGKKIDNLRSYLWRVVYTTALDMIAERQDYLPIERVQRTAEGDGSLPEALTVADRASETGDYRARLEEAVGSLPERRRAVARLYLAGEGIATIAASLGWGQNQVRHLLYRGLADIRKRLTAGGAGIPAAGRRPDDNDKNGNHQGGS